jgi:cobalt-zinc-cadmium efflux system outer membrane protein
MSKSVFLPIALLFLPGCLRVDTNPLPEFEQVREEVARRTGEMVCWEGFFEMPIESLTLEAAVQIALLNNRDLQAIYQTLGIEKANLAQAGLLTNPAFSLTWRFSTSSAVTDLVDWDIFQNLLETLLIPLKKRAAANELEAAKLMVAAKILEVIGQTKIAFYTLLAQEEIRELKQQEVLALECAYEAASRLYKAGNIKELEVNQRRSLYEAAKIEAADLEVAVLEARENLNILMGLWGNQICWKTVGLLPEVQQCVWENVENCAIANSLDLQAARLQIRATAASVGIDTSRVVFPQAEVGASGEREESIWFIGPAFALSIPIFDWGQAAAAAGQAEILRQWNHYTAMAVEIRSAARMMRIQFLNTRRQLRHYQETIVPLSEKATTLTLLQHNAMQLGVLDLLDAKKEEICSKMETLEIQKACLIAQTKLETLLRGHRL